jgi:hypothetical protein
MIMARLIKAISIVPHPAKEGLINLSLFSKNIKRLSEKIASFAFFNCYKSSSALSCFESRAHLCDSGSTKGL